MDEIAKGKMKVSSLDVVRALLKTFKTDFFLGFMTVLFQQIGIFGLTFIFQYLIISL